MRQQHVVTQLPRSLQLTAKGGRSPLLRPRVARAIPSRLLMRARARGDSRRSAVSAIATARSGLPREIATSPSSFSTPTSQPGAPTRARSVSALRANRSAVTASPIRTCRSPRAVSNPTRA